jgi:transposase InsO family protein
MDWCSRRILAWRLSNSLTTDFCIEAIAHHGRPELFNSDQGSQFTDSGFVALLAAHGTPGRNYHPTLKRYRQHVRAREDRIFNAVSQARCLLVGDGELGRPPGFTTRQESPRTLASERAYRYSNIRTPMCATTAAKRAPRGARNALPGHDGRHGGPKR